MGKSMSKDQQIPPPVASLIESCHSKESDEKFTSLLAESEIPIPETIIYSRTGRLTVKEKILKKCIRRKIRERSPPSSDEDESAPRRSDQQIKQWEKELQTIIKNFKKMQSAKKISKKNMNIIYLEDLIKQAKQWEKEVETMCDELDKMLSSKWISDENKTAVRICFTDLKAVVNPSIIGVVITKKMQLVEKFPRFSQLIKSITQHKEFAVEDRTKGKVEKSDQYKPGCEISFQVTGYKHHAVITKVEPNKLTIIHFRMKDVGFSSSNNRSLNGIRSSLSDSCPSETRKDTISFDEWGPKYIYDYGNIAFESDIIVDRAEMLLKSSQSLEVPYHLFKFNCMHFASYCVTGKCYSKKVDSWNLTGKHAENTEMQSVYNNSLCTAILKKLQKIIVLIK